MSEKIKGVLAGFVFRLIALLTLRKISPIVSACVIVERDGKILLLERSDGLGYTIPGGIVRYNETIAQCIEREVVEETGYQVELRAFVGVYSALKRDPRFRAIALVYSGEITGGEERSSKEGRVCWRTVEEVQRFMAFDCEMMIKDYRTGQQRFS